MSYANSTINSYNQSVNWIQGEPPDGSAGYNFGTQTTLTSGTQYKLNFNIGTGSWLIIATGVIKINDATTAWEPSTFGVYDSDGATIAADSLCGTAATYNNGTNLSNTLTLWTNSSPVQTNPFYVGFTPNFGGSTVAPQITVNVEYVKIR